MRRRRKATEERQFPSTILFMAGFLLGMIIPNLMWKKSWGHHVLTSTYLLTMVRQTKYIDRSMLYEIWKQKGCYLIITILSGFTIFGVSLAVIEIIILGFFTSAVITSSILQFGIYGAFIGAALLFPHYVFYYPACFYLLHGVYHESLMICKRRGGLPEKMSGYGTCILLAVSLTVAGSVLEIYANPGFLKLILKIFPVYKI